MAKYDKRKESKEEILELLDAAEVSVYLTSLSFKRVGYSYHQKRDIG